MSMLDNLGIEMKKRGYQIVENIASSKDILIRDGRVGCIILESQSGNRDEIKNILQPLNYKIMVRNKNDGTVQFIIKI